MTSGIYARASLDGAPIAERDRTILWLAGEAAGGCAVAAHDPDSDAIWTGDSAAFAGYLDEPDELAALLGVDSRASHAALAMAALDRFGDDTPAHLPGEWSLLQWDAAARELTLCVSRTPRDQLYFALAGARIAVAPDIKALAALDWIGRRIDPRGLLLHMGRAGMRRHIAGETILRNVTEVMPGTCVRVSAAGVRTRSVPPLAEPTEPWRGGFDDAIAELDALFGRIVARQLARMPSVAVMLSGGLDSSLIAAFAARERAAGQELFCVTSAAWPGSGIEDETAHSQAVADRLGIAMIPVAPHALKTFYRPSTRDSIGMQHPLTSPRHYLYDALADAAADMGAAGLFDGVGGELTITGYLTMPGRWRTLRRWARAALSVASGRARFVATPQDAFHVRLSPAAITLAETELAAEWRAPNQAMPDRAAAGRCGFVPGFEKIMGESTAMNHDGLRRLLPFRDPELLRLFAGMPAPFLTWGGVDRAPGRAMLAGKIPESVRLRPKGGAFSPDYHQRARDQAAAARARIPLFEAEGVDEWIDLVWLDQALARLESGGKATIHDVVPAQSTSIAAEFLLSFR